MYINHERKLTKRQRKYLKGPNAAVLASIKNGTQHGDYIGSPPEYFNTNMGNSMVPPQYVKVKKGVPFVRHSQ